jgi:hypothetical protein
MSEDSEVTERWRRVSESSQIKGCSGLSFGSRKRSACISFDLSYQSCNTVDYNDNSEPCNLSYIVYAVLYCGDTYHFLGENLFCSIMR